MLQVHGSSGVKTPPPVTPSGSTSGSGYDSDSGGTTNNNAPTTNLHEWYVCQAAGMPTPPSQEHSPLGGITGTTVLPTHHAPLHPQVF